MKLLFDLRWTGPEIAGISRYATELARELAQRGDVELSVLVCNDEQAREVPGVPLVWAHDPQGPQSWREVMLPRRLDRLGFDVVYCPVFFMGLAPHRFTLVLTVHDTIPFEFPEPPRYISRSQRLGWRFFYGSRFPMRTCLATADRLVTVSQTARHMLSQAFPHREWHVVPNGVRQLGAPAAPADHAASTDVCYMGVFSQHKNVEVLIDALVHAPRITLHLLSRIPPCQREAYEQRAAGIGVAGRLVFHNGVSDEDYVELLDRSRCLVTASKLEGFGLPIIEAQSRGCPVACSDIPIFHEVAGEHAEFFDPDDATAVAAAWERLADPGRSQELSEAGPRNAGRYTWQRSADALLAVLRDE